MAVAAESATLPWWREPTREQWHAWIAAWLGWTLDAFDFTIFLLLMLPISRTFNVPLVDVTAVLAITLWMRLVGATASGWLADRMGRKKPLMISIAWYSVANLLAGLAPSFGLLFLFRALMGIGMGAEWPVGAALAMEQWPIRSRGFMSGVLQGSLGARRASVERGLRAAVQLHRLARSLDHRRASRARDPLRPPLRQGAGGVAGKPPASARGEARGEGAVVEHLQARHPRQHGDGLLVDGEQLRRRLFDERDVCDLAAKGSGAEPGAGGLAGHVAEHRAVWVGYRLGLDRRPHRSPLVDHPAGRARDPDRSALPLHRQLRDDRRVLWRAGVACRRRHLEPGAQLSFRAVPDRSASDGIRILLPPGRDLGRLRQSGRDLFRAKLAPGVRDPDGHRHDRRAGQLAAGTLGQSGNSRQGTGRRRRTCLSETFTQSAMAIWGHRDASTVPASGCRHRPKPSVAALRWVWHRVCRATALAYGGDRRPKDWRF